MYVVWIDSSSDPCEVTGWPTILTPPPTRATRTTSRVAPVHARSWIACIRPPATAHRSTGPHLRVCQLWGLAPPTDRLTARRRTCCLLLGGRAAFPNQAMSVSDRLMSPAFTWGGAIVRQSRPVRESSWVLPHLRNRGHRDIFDSAAVTKPRATSDVLREDGQRGSQ